jgi:alpha-1,3-mannosyltransferase
MGAPDGKGAESGASPRRPSAPWWLLLLLFVSVGPLLFAATHHRRPAADPRIAHALDTLHEEPSVALLTELAGQLRAEQRRAALAALAALAERTGRLGRTCRDDPDVRSGLDRGSRFLISANLHNSADILPHWVTQLTAALRALPPENVFVSIYESGSGDGTGGWLRQLALRLALLGVRSRITVGGNVTRQEGEQRIAYLAKLRNEALAPMLGAQPEFQPDYVVFLNDVHFCADELLRLTLHKADLACGLDLWYYWLGRRSRSLAQEQVQPQPQPQPAGGGQGQQRRHQRRRAAAPPPPAAAVPEARRGKTMQFYDFWVARDVDGRRYRGDPPYLPNQATAARAAQGLPVPAVCCWNGMAVLRAAPLRAGLRFRAHRAGECRASECSLLCDDLHRLGYSDVVVDPGVRTAYKLVHAEDLYIESQVPLRVAGWREVAAAVPHRQLGLRPALGRVECCDLAEGQELVDWGKPCRFLDVLAANFTRLEGA